MSDIKLWAGPIGFEGQVTGDGRLIDHNALKWDGLLPVPLRYTQKDVGAHDGAEVAGHIIDIERLSAKDANDRLAKMGVETMDLDDGILVIWGSGDFDIEGDVGAESYRQVKKELTNGISMDLDDVGFEVRTASLADGASPEAVDRGDELMVTSSARVRAATQVAIPAFAGARIHVIGEKADDEEDANDNGADEAAEGETPTDQTDKQKTPPVKPGADLKKVDDGGQLPAPSGDDHDDQQEGEDPNDPKAKAKAAKAKKLVASARVQAMQTLARKRFGLGEFSYNPDQWRSPDDGQWIDMPAKTILDFFNTVGSDQTTIPAKKLPPAYTEKIQEAQDAASSLKEGGDPAEVATQVEPLLQAAWAEHPASENRNLDPQAADAYQNAIDSLQKVESIDWSNYDASAFDDPEDGADVGTTDADGAIAEEAPANEVPPVPQAPQDVKDIQVPELALPGAALLDVISKAQSGLAGTPEELEAYDQLEAIKKQVKAGTPFDEFQYPDHIAGDFAPEVLPAVEDYLNSLLPAEDASGDGSDQAGGGDLASLGVNSEEADRLTTLGFIRYEQQPDGSNIAYDKDTNDELWTKNSDGSYTAGPDLDDWLQEDANSAARADAAGEAPTADSSAPDAGGYDLTIPEDRDKAISDFGDKLMESEGSVPITSQSDGELRAKLTELGAPDELLDEIMDHYQDLLDMGYSDLSVGIWRHFDKLGTFNWVDDVGGLPAYIREVADGVGKTNPTWSESRQIATAVSMIKRWARGGGGVTAETQVKAAAALAEWEVKRARANADAVQPTVYQPEERGSLVASGAKLELVAPIKPPRSWFENPGFDGPTPLTVTPEGQVYGHLATWDVCHLAAPMSAVNGCVSAPHSDTDYQWFHLGAVETEEGEHVSVGRLVMETGHAGDNWSARRSIAHYENTGLAMADVHAGEDAYGIWFAGALRPDATPAQIRSFKASPLSGDWRRHPNGNLELVMGLAVNMPGFAVPRPRGLVASGAVQSLVAAGMLPPRTVTREKVEAAKGGDQLALDDLRYLRKLAQRERDYEAEQLRMRVSMAQNKRAVEAFARKRAQEKAKEQRNG